MYTFYPFNCFLRNPFIPYLVFNYISVDSEQNLFRSHSQYPSLQADRPHSTVNKNGCWGFSPPLWTTSDPYLKQTIADITQTSPFLCLTLCKVLPQSLWDITWQSGLPQYAKEGEVKTMSMTRKNNNTSARQCLHSSVYCICPELYYQVMDMRNVVCS